MVSEGITISILLGGFVAYNLWRSRRAFPRIFSMLWDYCYLLAEKQAKKKAKAQKEERA